jgi:serine/threonine protein phosphatase PrpC
MIRNPFETTPEEKPPEMEVTAVEPEVMEVADEEIEAVTLRPPAMPSPEFLLDEQLPDIIEGKEVAGFPQLEVAYTLAKKNANRPEKLPNEDTALADPRNGLLGVFDGLGGVKGSARASALAAKDFPTVFWKLHARVLLRADEDISTAVRERINQRTQERISLRPPGKYPEEIQALQKEQEGILHVLTQDNRLAAKTLALLESFDNISARILKTETKTETTGCVGFIHTTEDGKRYAVVGNVGDSGAFVIRKDGTASSITHDDSLTNEQLEAHTINAAGLLELKQNPQKKYNMTISIHGQQQVMDYDYLGLGAAVLRTLGRTETAAVSLSITELEPGDDIVFCTDGVIDKYETMAKPDTTAEELIQKPIALQELGGDFRSQDKLTTRINDLRLNANFRRAYKLDDDIAIVAAHIPEEKKDEPQT